MWAKGNSGGIVKRLRIQTIGAGKHLTMMRCNFIDYQKLDIHTDRNVKMRNQVG